MSLVDDSVHMGVVLKVLVKEGPSGIHFLKKGILTKQGTYIMAILGTGILNNYDIEKGSGPGITDLDS